MWGGRNQYAEGSVSGNRVLSQDASVLIYLLLSVCLHCVQVARERAVSARGYGFAIVGEIGGPDNLRRRQVWFLTIEG